MFCFFVELNLEITSWPQLFGSQNMMSFQGCKYFKDAQTEPLGRNLLELLSFSAGHRSLLSSSLLSLSLLSFSAPCRDKRQHGLWFIMCDRSTCDICRLLTVLSELHCSFCYSHTFFVLHSVYQVPQVPSLFCVILRFVFFSSVYFLKRLGKGSNNQNGNLGWVFSMKGGRGLEFHTPILKNDFSKTIKNHSLTVKTCFALSLGFILCLYCS